MKLRLWRGHHTPELMKELQRAWSGDGLLILCPPGLKNFDFLGALPADSVTIAGEWNPALLQLISLASRGGPDRRLDSTFLGVFTSGTLSGKPRLVLYSRRNVEASLDGVREFFEVSRIRSIFCYPQPFHTFGLVLGYLHALRHGLELVTGAGPYGRAFHELWLERADEGTLTLGTPTHLIDLIERVKTGPRPRESYSAIVGGARVTQDLWRSLRNVLGIQLPSIGYGATEASPGIAHHPPGREPTEDGEIGFPLGGVEVTLRPGAGIEFTGENACLAVVEGGRAEQSRSWLIRDDVERRSDGMLLYRGRIDLLINRGGQKLSLEHIEERLHSALGVHSICLGVPDFRLGEDLGVLVRFEDAREGARDEGRISRLLGGELGIRLNPDNVFFVAELPLNPGMKADRVRAARILRERCADV